MKIRAFLFAKIQAFLFLALLMISFYFNRLAVDDYYFIAELGDHSFGQVFSDLHLKWHGRWSSNFFLLALMKAYPIPFFLLLINCVSTGLVLTAIHWLSKTINKKYKWGLTTGQLWIYSILFLSVFFFCNPNPNETWFWYTGSVVYFWSIGFLLFVINVLLKSDIKPMDYLLLVGSLLFVGGANEPLSFFMIFAFIILIYKGFKRPTSFVGFTVLLGSFLINYLSPGTIHRDEITPGLDLLDTIFYSGYATVNYLFFDFHKSFQIGILMAIPFYILGKHLSIDIGFNPLKNIIYGALFIGVITFTNALLGTIALGGLPPDRSMIASSIVIAATIVWISFGLGNRSKGALKFIYLVPAWASIYLLVLNIYCFDVHHTYANAVDSRIKKINASNEQLIVVEPLPSSGYLYNAEITSDTLHYKNVHLKRGLKLGLEQQLMLDSTSLE